MTPENPCPFCAIIRGQDPNARVVYTDERVAVFFPLNPATRGHTLVVPRRHVSEITDLRPDEGRDIADAIGHVARAMYQALAPEGLNIIQSNGHAATQTILHLHVHLVPRWEGDRMGLTWPDGPADDDASQDDTLNAIRQAVETMGIGSRAVPEDRRQHLSFIQAVVTRMSQASSSSKSWLLPIVTATYGYAISQHSAGVALLGILAVVVFGVLDANYLKQERAFRKLYDDVAVGRNVTAFSMNPALPSPDGKNVNYWPDWRDVKSWAVAPVYGPLLAAGLAILLWPQGG
ncbi:hypothetical protein GCM10027053_47530 [Intrasporangium mesophilum]